MGAGMSFTDGKPFIATEANCKASWGGGKNGSYFRCYFCGHKFKPGDTVRWQYTNDISGAGGNPMVCERCDGPPADVRAAWAEKCEEARTRFWWFTRED